MTKIVRAVSHPVSLFICGDLAYVQQHCVDFYTDVGLCVTVTPTYYAFRDGAEHGVIIGLINYPRFAKTDHPELIESNLGVYEIERIATRLGYYLLTMMPDQLSFTVQGPTETVWHSNRPEDLA